MDYVATMCGCAYGCPKGKRNQDCPIFKIEHLSFKERVIFINELDDDEVREFIDHHSICTNKIENK